MQLIFTGRAPLAVRHVDYFGLNVKRYKICNGDNSYYQEIISIIEAFLPDENNKSFEFQNSTFDYKKHQINWLKLELWSI